MNTDEKESDIYVHQAQICCTRQHGWNLRYATEYLMIYVKIKMYYSNTGKIKATKLENIHRKPDGIKEKKDHVPTLDPDPSLVFS